jgi:putative phage-type endonuclease
MQVLELQQGSEAWHQARAQHFTASEAPAMMGASKYTSRQDLLRQKHSGIAPDVDAATQRRFDSGHAAEAAARAIVQQRLGEDLYPVTGTLEVEGLPLLASFDGLTITDDLVWETKLLSNSLLSQVQAGELEPHYYWQLEQQLLVSGAKKAYFTASDGTEEGTHGIYYESRPERRAALIAGWKQFAEDLKAYVPPAASAVEKIVAEPVEALPAPVVKVTGEIALVDNFKAFEERLREFLATKLIREPKTDEDFVNLDSQIKAMKSAREALKSAEAQMLAQVQPVDQAKKTKDMLDKVLQQNVSMAEKILDAEKERRKGEIVAVGVKGLADHIASLNQRLGKPYMPNIPADFGGCIKGLKSLASMEDKVATELARAKIAASEVADKLQKNLEYLREHAADFKHLFPDTEQIIGKAHDDLQALVQNRITAHKQAEEKRLEAERAAIRAEEERRANEKAQAQLAASQAKQQSAVAPTLDTVLTAVAPAPIQQALATPIKVNPVPPAANDDARIKLGDINSRIAPLSISADGLAELGFPHVGTAGSAKLYRESDYPRICEALIQHLTQVADLQVA